jgi:DNA repair protein RadC
VNRSAVGSPVPVPVTGIRGETVTDVSQRLLVHHGGLRGLLRLDIAELPCIRGRDDAEAVRLKAALGG